jgi:FkbM family methyltransferase
VPVLADVWRLRPYAYGALDRGQFRVALARTATWAARRETSAPVEVFHDGIWMFRVGDRYFPGEDRFVYRHGDDLARWPEAERRLAEELWFHVYRPRPGAIIVDAGAGIGGETQVFAETVGSTGRVLSIEASPVTFARLAARVRWNRLDNVALVDRSRPAYVEDRREVYERNTVGFEPRDRWTMPVDGVSLDELCEQHGIDHIDLLKLNIEGAERHAIAGMRRIIERTDAVCIACHDFWGAKDRAFETRTPVLAFLRESGFEIVTRDDDPRVFVRDHVHAVRP